MERVNCVRFESSEIRKPAGGVGGLPKKNISRMIMADDEFTSAFAGTLQARSAVGFIIDLSKRLGRFDGTNAGAMDELKARFLIGWRIYVALYPSNIRAAFSTLTGATIDDFEHALQAIGWHIATPEARARHMRNPQAIITPRDLA